jgi:PIN domain
VLEEYSEVLARPKFAFSPDEIAALTDLLHRQGDLVHPYPLSGMSPDPKDDKFMACALAAQADFMVTGNKQDFPQDRLGDTQVASAGEPVESDHPRILAATVEDYFLFARNPTLSSPPSPLRRLVPDRALEPSKQLPIMRLMVYYLVF